MDQLTGECAFLHISLVLIRAVQHKSWLYSIVYDIQFNIFISDLSCTDIRINTKQASD